MTKLVNAYQFFNGLTVEGVQETLDEYMNATTGSFQWEVHTLRKDEDGFYLLLERSFD